MDTKLQMTEEEFVELVKGLDLAPSTLAILRRNVGLPFDERLASQQDRERRSLMTGWTLIPDRAPK